MARLGTVKWYDKEVVKLTREAVAAGLTRGAIVLQGAMKRNLGSMGNPSQPGEYPGIRTGNMRRSISHQAATAKQLVSAAGTPLGFDNYPLWLEFGTSKMAARPWAMRSYRSAEQVIKAEIRARAREAFAIGAKAQSASKGRRP
jgi:hypothetical protein